MPRFLFAFALLIGTAASAAAAPITCAQFNEALARSIEDQGRRVATPDLSKPAYKRPDGTMIRYDMSGIVGMTGSIECHENDRLWMISVETALKSTEATIRVLRFHWLLAASICAVEHSTKVACDAKANAMIKNAVNEFSKAQLRGEPEPSSFQKITVKGDVNIEVDVDPGRLSFSITPPWGKAS